MQASLRTGAWLLWAGLCLLLPCRAGEPDLARRLEALEKARDAGVLTEEEYASKRAALLAASPETARKLAALDKARDAGILTDEEYARKRAELLGGTPRALPVHTQKQGSVYRHVAGFSFWYPAGWTVKEHEMALQLVPEDAGATADGPTELYFVVVESAGDSGITSATDPRVIEYLDTQVKSIAPAVTRTGEARPVALAKGEGRCYRWTGRTPKGDEVEGRAWASVMKGHGVALIAVGFRERLAARDADLDRMFASFGIGEGERDPALVGTWTLVGIAAITNQSPWESDWSRAQVASETKSTLTFSADGRWERVDETHMILGAGDVWLEDRDRTEAKGRWNAGRGTLFMVWDDGSWDDFTYRIEQTPNGPELRTLRGKHGEVWGRP